MTFQERYQYNPTKDLLGKGGFARVFKAKDVLLDRDVAIKVFNATDKGQYTVIEEIKKAIRLTHPNLLRYYDVEVLETTNALGEVDTIQIGVMELANAGDLKQFARNNPNSPQLFHLLQQVLSGLEYLHQKGIIHRDLKPQNILLVEEDGELTAKISDFGISKSMESGTNSSSMAIGTIEYMAPEQFNPSKYGINGKINTNVDLWSFGIMVHELLTNEPVFGQRNGNTTAEQIMNAILSQTLPPDIETLPEPYKRVVKKCLVSDARQRIQKAKEIIALLNEEVRQEENQSFNSFSDGNETVQLDKSMLNRANNSDSGETMVMPKIKEESKIPSYSMPQETKEKSPVIENPKKAKSNKMIFAGIGVVLLIGIVIFIFKGKNGNAGLEEYQHAMFNKNDTSVYYSHLRNAADLGYDSACFILCNDYAAQGHLQFADPYLEKLISKSNDKITSSFVGIIALYALDMIQSKNQLDSGLALLKNNAIINNDVACVYQLGLLYYEGKNVTQDYSEATKWFKKGAELNEDKSEAMLGNIYIMGLGVPSDYTEAIKYYSKAAEKGNAVGMYALGLAYKNGTGVEKNTDEAEKWFQQVIDKSSNADVVNAAKKQLAPVKKD